MASERAQFLGAVEALARSVWGANCAFRRMPDSPMIPAPGGNIDMRDGVPGDPDIVLSPVTYTYQHEVYFEVLGFESGTLSHDEIIESLTAPFGEAIEADRTLGGACAYALVTAPVTDIERPDGAAARAWAAFSVIGEYQTRHPLGRTTG